MGAPVRILYLAGELTTGGYQQQLRLLLTQLDAQVITPFVAVWRAGEDQELLPAFRELGVPVHTVPEGNSRWERLGSLERLVADFRPDYIHSYAFYTNAIAWWLCRRLHARGAMGSIRSDYWHDRSLCGPFIGRLSGALPRHMIANSEAATRSAESARSLFKPNRVWTVPNSVDLEVFRPRDPGDAQGSGNGEVRILGVGRLSPEKRWPLLLAILARLREDGSLPPWSFTLCGDGVSRAEVERAIQEHSLGDVVTLAGYQANVADWLRSSDLLAFCSEFEGTPNVVAEALSCGVPVVTTDVGDVKQLVRSGQDGHVVPVSDVDGFATALKELVGSATLRQQFGSSAQSWMKQSRAPIRLVERTLAAYREAGWKLP